MLGELERLMPGRITSKAGQEIDYLAQDYGEGCVDDCIQKMLAMDTRFTSPLEFLR
jgi:hypothetical protein